MREGEQHRAPDISFEGLTPVEIVRKKIINGIPLTVDENKLWEERLEEERIDDQAERRGRY